jgi:hypothetical protein
MALYSDYCTLAELKAYLRIGDTGDDVELPFAITAASRAVDRACNRQFGQITTAEARYYTWEKYLVEGRSALAVFDLYTVTDLAVAFDPGADGTYEETVTISTDFDLYPWNAAVDSRPWTHVVLQPDSAFRFPVNPRGVRVTARFGWTAVPTTIKQATLLQASRFFTRRNSPYGIAGSPDMGSEMRLLARLDPDVAVMVGPYRRQWGAI